MALQNFVGKVGPVVSAIWLNAVDVLKFTIFADATTKAQARTALTSDAPLEQINGGTGSRTFITDLAAGTGTLVGNTTIKIPQTAAELAALVTPVNLYYLPGDVRRYGGIGDSSTNCTTAFTNAIASNVVVTVPFASGNYKCTSSVTVTAGVTIKFDGGIVDQSSGTFIFSNHSHMAASETQQCFTNTSAVNFGYDAVANVYAQWWGFGHQFTAANNKTSLLAAMNSLTTSGQVRGGTVVLPNTACTINGDIVPPGNGLRLLGQGWSAGYNDTTQVGTSLTFATGTNGFDLTAYFGTANPNEYFLLEGTRIDGNSVLTNGLNIKGTKFVKGCIVTGCNSIGIYLSDQINGTSIEDTTCVSNNAAGGGVGLLVEGTNTTKFTVRNSHFRINFRGMEIRSGQNFTLQDCVFESNAERGLLEANADNSNLNAGIHQNLWFENNNALAQTRSQYTLKTTASTAVWYPTGHKFIGGNINGSSVAGQRIMDINSNCLNTSFSGTRFANIAADTGSIFVASGCNVIFDDCWNTTAGETVDSAASGSVGNYRQRNINFLANVLAAVTVTYSASMTINASLGNEFIITANNNTAFTINAPTIPSIGQAIEITIRNTSGGALGAATWNAVFKMSAWTSPANANSRTIAFRYDGTNWIQRLQATVDVPN